MLIINNNQLDMDEFKDRYKSFDWVRVPRSLGVDHKDYFYIASFEDENWKISIKTRPSMRMSISETYKHCDVKGNKIDPKSSTKFEFGSTVEVVITKNTLNEIKKIAKELPPVKTQKVDL